MTDIKEMFDLSEGYLLEFIDKKILKDLFYQLH